MTEAIKSEESVEDIISSIKEVMSENINKGHPSSAKTKSAPGPVKKELPTFSPKSKDVLVLSTLIQEDGTVKLLTHKDAKTYKESLPPASIHKKGSEDLLSRQTINESLAGLSALSSTLPHTGKLQKKVSDAKQVGDYSVEELAREMLRPMLKEWLDANLATLVKWIVTEQIEKICQQRPKSD